MFFYKHVMQLGSHLGKSSGSRPLHYNITDTANLHFTIDTSGI